MGNQLTNVNLGHQNEDICHELSRQFQEMRQQHPKRFPIPTCILETVHSNVNGEWEQRLLQAKEIQKTECIIIFPYQLAELHWIGFIIKSRKNGQVERAEFIDPIQASDFNPNELQEKFTKIYPGIILRQKDLKKKTDKLQKSAQLTIKYLLKAVNKAQLSGSTQKSPTMNIGPEVILEPADSLTEASGEEEDENKEDLNNMHKDFLSMPSCSERSVISLMYHVSLELTIALNQRTVKPETVEMEISKELLSLKERLKEEELSSLELGNFIGELQIHISKKNWNNSLTLLKKIFKEISPLNMHELFRIIEKVDNTAQLIKNKDVLLFLGDTGSGKSTAIHFLGGSKMNATEVNGLNHIAPVKIRNSDLREIKTAPNTVGITRYITPVKVNLKDVGVDSNDSIVLCDSPGLGDTTRPEVDIANGIGIIKAIKGCKTVRPIILISYKSIDDRFDGWKNLTHIVAGLIPGIQNHLRALSFVFTKCAENEKNRIHASLVNIRKNMSDEERLNSNFMNLFENMLNRTEHGALVIDPIHDKPARILNQLVKSTAIHHPDEVFQFSTGSPRVPQSRGILTSCIADALMPPCELPSPLTTTSPTPSSSRRSCWTSRSSRSSTTPCVAASRRKPPRTGRSFVSGHYAADSGRASTP